jgi:hypothetical protein
MKDVKGACERAGESVSESTADPRHECENRPTQKTETAKVRAGRPINALQGIAAGDMMKDQSCVFGACCAKMV